MVISSFERGHTQTCLVACIRVRVTHKVAAHSLLTIITMAT